MINIKKTVATGAAALTMLGAAIVPAFADTININFEPATYSLGNINGQDGWSKTGPFDVEVESNTYGFTSFGTQSLRISDAIVSGSFGDQTFSKSLINASGETSAEYGSHQVELNNHTLKHLGILHLQYQVQNNLDYQL